LESIRAKATELGVKWHPAQKAETIQYNIDQFLEANAPTIIQPPVKDETDAERIKRELQEAMALIPVTVTSMDPADANLQAVIVSVGNRKLGQISKAIPFGYKWYMPKILIDEMEATQFCRTTMVPTGHGTERPNTQWMKKYAIQYHPLPTPKELADLAKAQAQGNELAK
jgi:hypothetical protein